MPQLTFPRPPVHALPLLTVAVLLPACTAADRPGDVRAFTGARILDGTGAGPIDDGVLLVRDGRVEAVGPRDGIEVPDDAEAVDLSGHTVVPGFVNAHGHVGTARGLESGAEVYTRDNVVEQLRLNARYGVTTVVSLGGGGPAGVEVRDGESRADLDRARLRLAGPVLDPDAPDEVPALIDELDAMGVDWVKIRIDDALGRGEKMPPEVYRAVIEEAHRRDLPVAVHVVYREDAVDAVRAGADLIAHSVRDEPVGDELIDLMLENDVCLVPTLTREISTFVYRERPAFFDDPFFRREADPEVLDRLQEPERQAEFDNPSARFWEEALPLARRNLKALHDAGVGIAFGTDAGPPARFQGYFEHMEMEQMAEAGLQPAEILRAATGEAARCAGLDDQVGTLEPGRWADFVVLRRDPLRDIRHARAIESVWVAGNRVAGSRWDPSETGLDARSR